MVLGAVVAAAVGLETSSAVWALLAGALAGAAYAAPAAVCENRLGVPLLISTLLLSCPAISLAGYLVRFLLKDSGSSLPQSAQLPPGARLPEFGGVTSGIVLVVVVAAVCAVVDARTPAGFEARVIFDGGLVALALTAVAPVLLAALGGGVDELPGAHGVRHAGQCRRPGAGRAAGPRRRALAAGVPGVGGGSGARAVPAPAPWGLRLRGVGEDPAAAADLGVRPDHYRYGAVLAAGALCGLGGAQLALGSVTLFAENLTAGRGWIAVVAVLLGRARPVGVLLALFAGTGWRGLAGRRRAGRVRTGAPGRRRRG